MLWSQKWLGKEIFEVQLNLGYLIYTPGKIRHYLMLADDRNVCRWMLLLYAKPIKEWTGIHDVVSGYKDGHLDNPTYEDVKKSESGHFEVDAITYDPAVFSNEKLLDIF